MRILGQLITIFAWACSGNGLDDRSRIERARVLAVQADPPILTMNNTVNLRALVVTPDGGVLTGETFRICYPWAIVGDPDRDCDLGNSFPLADRDGVAQFSFDRTFAELVSGFDLPDGVFDPCEPAERYLGLTLVYEAQIGSERLVAVKRLRFYADVAQPVQNPSLSELSFEAHESGLLVRALLAGEALGCDVSTSETRDPWRLSLYVNEGATENGRMELVPDEFSETVWETGPTERARIWAVVTDCFGGVSWSEHSPVRPPSPVFPANYIDMR